MKLTKKFINELTKKLKKSKTIDTFLQQYQEISQNYPLILYFHNKKVIQVRKSKLLDNYLFFKFKDFSELVNLSELRYIKLKRN